MSVTVLVNPEAPTTDKDLTSQLNLISKSGVVRRFHTVETLSPQSVGEHTYGVLCLLLILTEGRCSHALLRAGLLHDAAEYLTGDVPSPVKRKYADAFAIMDRDAEQKLNLPYAPVFLSAEEYALLKMADCLEGYMYCLRELAKGNTLIAEPLSNFQTYSKLAVGTHPVGVKIHDHLTEQLNELRRK